MCCHVRPIRDLCLLFLVHDFCCPQTRALIFLHALSTGYTGLFFPSLSFLVGVLRPSSGSGLLSHGGVGGVSAPKCGAKHGGQQQGGPSGVQEEQSADVAASLGATRKGILQARDDARHHNPSCSGMLKNHKNECQALLILFSKNPQLKSVQQTLEEAEAPCLYRKRLESSCDETFPSRSMAYLVKRQLSNKASRRELLMSGVEDVLVTKSGYSRSDSTSRKRLPSYAHLSQGPPSDSSASTSHCSFSDKETKFKR